VLCHGLLGLRGSIGAMRSACVCLVHVRALFARRRGPLRCVSSSFWWGHSSTTGNTANAPSPIGGRTEGSSFQMEDPQGDVVLF
jgi:hypothetical protein